MAERTRRNLDPANAAAGLSRALGRARIVRARILAALARGEDPELRDALSRVESEQRRLATAARRLDVARRILVEMHSSGDLR
jgi:hypothetical protein